MTLLSEIPNLTTALDQLTEETNVSKAVLDAKVSTTETEAANAQTEQTLAEGARDEASAHATAAALHLATVKTDVTYEAIEAVVASKAEDAVAVFVYDTSMDSDGGAWRKRCQHLSWFNEELNTATRGARREFPAVALIVVSASSFALITIYDADDPELPMWMVFSSQGSKSYHAHGTEGVSGGPTFGFNSAYTDGPSGIQMLNGKMAFSMSFLGNNRWGGLYRVDFLSEQTTLLADGADPYGTQFRPLDIANRNTFLEPAYEKSNDGAFIVSSTGNDVAMTVLPDAPVDPDTGLPVPTIAVATDGGVSVINHDGTVTDSLSTFGFSYVGFDDAQALYASRNQINYLALFSDVTDYTSGDGFGTTSFIYYGGVRMSALNHGFAWNSVVKGGFSLHHGTPFDDKPLRAEVTGNYSTGWMPGDIKGAWLADTDNQPLSDVELNTDADLNDASKWNDFWTVSGGTASAPVGSAGYLQPTNSFTEPLPKGYYTVEVDFVVGTFVQIYYDGGVLVVTPESPKAIIYHGGNARPRLRADGTEAREISRFSVKRNVDADRSITGNHLNVVGSVTRDPVATNASLLGYTDFDGGGYLEIPDATGLPIGSAEWSMMFWVNYWTNTRSVMEWPVAEGESIFLRNTQDRLNVGSTYQGHAYFTVPGLLNPDWKHITLTRSNGLSGCYVNGQFISEIADGRNIAPIGYLRVGGGFITSGQAPSFGSLALVRISATAPTPDQIAKIYEDERKLFQPNAKCTLYGTSSKVTALAHDPKTNLLHVGTPSGRSVFDGLVRVDNTETPVTTAISAVNGMILEQ